MPGLSPLNSSNPIRKVLYVEDDSISITLFEAMMASLPGITLYLSQTAEAGIEIAVHEQPDFIFLDIMLPGMDGITALGILKADPRLENCTFIGLSANAMPDQVRLAREVGFDRYVTKPYSLEQIAQIVGAGG